MVAKSKKDELPAGAAREGGVKLTAAQRRKQQEQQRQEELKVKRAAFDAERELRWYRFLAHALILDRQAESEQELRDQHSWFFESFSVDVAKEEVTVDGRTYSREDDSFSFDTFERAESDLAQGREYYTAHLEEQERKRQEELRRQARRQSGLSKLTAEEVEALNLGHLVPRR